MKLTDPSIAMMNPGDAFRMAWEKSFHRVPEVNRVTVTVGGSINDVFKIDTEEGSFILKMNALARFPAMFSSEAKGLQRIAQAGCIGVPAVVTVVELKQHQLLIMEYVEPAVKINNYYPVFAEQLAALHRITSEKYGLDFNNRMGALPQDNTPENSVAEFMIRRRLSPQLRLALRNGKLSTDDDTKFQNLFKKLNELIPQEKPALIHGDLWSGNVITGNDGKAWLIDPAIAFYHREADIAMTRLFGKFEDDFYSSYDAVWPLTSGWEHRVDIWNLYPLLVHVNLFGESYVRSVRDILARYV